MQVEESFPCLLGKELNGRHLLRINLSSRFRVHQLPITDRTSKLKIRSAMEKIKTKRWVLPNTCSQVHFERLCQARLELEERTSFVQILPSNVTKWKKKKKRVWGHVKGFSCQAVKSLSEVAAIFLSIDTLQVFLDHHPTQNISMFRNGICHSFPVPRDSHLSWTLLYKYRS